MARKTITIVGEDLDNIRLDPDAIFRNVQERALDIYQKLAQDYDLTDLNENDRLAISDWCTIMVRIEDLEKEVSLIIATDTSDEKWYKIERINKVLASLRESASRNQSDLSLTRKQRKGDNETSVVAFIDSLKQRAKTMLDERLSYIYCPKCRELVATTWFLYPEVEGGNSVTLTCGRTTDRNKICGHRFTVSSAELAANGNKNLTDVLPT
jgi:hypothetical protein